MGRWRLICAAGVFAMVVGCATLGPSDPAQLQVLAVAALPANDNRVVAMSPGQWHANARGFSDVRNMRLVPEPRLGVIVMTEQSIFFEQWEREGFKILRRFPRARISEASVDTFGLGERLVLQFDDYETHSFAFTDIGNIGYARGKVADFFGPLPAAVKK